MKKIISLSLLAISFLTGLNAQDVITMKDGTDVQAKIIEVNPSEIRYKKYSNPDGPIFTINKSGND